MPILMNGTTASKPCTRPCRVARLTVKVGGTRPHEFGWPHPARREAAHKRLFVGWALTERIDGLHTGEFWPRQTLT